jgi:GntR family transcriptional regulator
MLFRVDTGSGVPLYRQLVQQVHREVMLGRLQPGDQLPSLTEVVSALSINPNTVVKAYSELEHQGFVVRRQGAGTFIMPVPPSTGSLAVPVKLRRALHRWVERTREAGVTDDQIRMLVADALTETGERPDQERADGTA